MIEVEQRFVMRPGDELNFTNGAEFIKEVILDSRYYDTDDLDLLQQRWRLRIRNGEWELKIPLNDEKQSIDQTAEISDETEIKNKLKLDNNKPMGQALIAAGYAEIGHFMVNRKKYRLNNFNIDLDKTDYGTSTVEIEMMVDQPDDVALAKKQINEYIASLGLSLVEAPGKLLAYLRIKNPELLNKLTSSTNG